MRMSRSSWSTRHSYDFVTSLAKYAFCSSNSCRTETPPATASICSIVLLIFPPFLAKKSMASGRAFVKDHVPCLSMLCRHRLEANGASTPTLFRCRGGDGKRLTGSDTEAACCPAVIEQTDTRSRGRDWRAAIRTHRQVGS